MADRVGAGPPKTLSHYFSRPIPFFFFVSSLKMRSWMVRFLLARELRMRLLPTFRESIQATALVYATMSSFSTSLLFRKDAQEEMHSLRIDYRSLPKRRAALRRPVTDCWLIIAV
jgi:hypothetical protein